MRLRRGHRGGGGGAAGSAHATARPVLASLVLLATVAGPAGAAGDDAGTAGGPADLSVGLEVSGVHRSAVLVLPPERSVAPRRRPPLLVVLHGVGMRGSDMRSLGFDAMAARQGVVVAYPDAWHGSWNDGRPGLEPASPDDVVDDVAFLRSLISEVGARAGADTARVAVVGFSNGALMAGRLACDAPAGVVAVGLVAGTVGEGFASSCTPSGRLPVVVVAGTGDATVPYGGGQIADFNGRKRGRVAGVGEFLAFWRAVDGCGAVAEAPVPGAAVAVSRIEWRECDRGGAVVHYRIEGGGHDWYRVGGFDTTAAVWRFVTPWLGISASPGRPWTAPT
ncbi:MAG: alpha/beta hydrolase family esterase [Acidimicrobiales bacterium]